MISDIKLKIRHAKRGNEKLLDLSGQGMLELPADITQLTMLESLNLSNNKLTNLKKVEQLPNLRVLNASNNNISTLHSEMFEMFSIETLYLMGNPIANNHPQLAKIENNQTQLKKALEQYFGINGGATLSGLSGIGSQTLTGGNLNNISNQSVGSMSSCGMSSFGGSQLGNNTGRSNLSMGSISQGPQVSFLQGDKNMNDPAILRKMIAELEQENRKLKEQDASKMNNQFNQSFNIQGNRGATQDKDWMKFGNQPLDRPTTANTQNQKFRELEEEIKFERKEKKKLVDEIENLKHELQKSNFSAFTQTSSSISVSSGRLPQVPGVREITLNDIEIGDQISQGGFSVIHKGTLNGTPVAIKKIFDPRLTDDLLYEIYNEIVMQSILRHPNITLLMGVMPKIPNIIIVFEHMSQGSLYNLLHLKKSINLSLEMRLKMAKDIAMVFHYIHSLGIVHRDIKSHNILVDENYNIKICDFGLARFNADLNKGSMQYSGTPAYMSPELFQKRQYDESVDIFAYGTLLWELVCREVPYDGLDPTDIRSRVEREEAFKMPYGTDPCLVQLIKDCRQTNSSNRPRFQKIIEILSVFTK